MDPSTRNDEPSEDLPIVRAPFSAPSGERLEVIRPLGKGASAIVYLAREPSLRRLVAVKCLRTDLGESPTARERFEREARAAAQIFHPHVAPVFGVGRLGDGLPYLVMPFIKGQNYEQRLVADGPRPPAEVVEVLRCVAMALSAAHARNIVHRDLRPSNVIIEDDTGHVFLTDFGLSAVLETGDEVVDRLTQSGEIVVQGVYASREQRLGGAITDRTDVYGLGVLGVTLLNGDPPEDASTKALESALDAAAIRAPDLVGHLRRWVADMPEHRPGVPDLIQNLDKLRDRDGRHWYKQLFPPKVRRMAEVLAAVGGGGWLVLELIDQLEDQSLLPPIAYDLTLPTVIALLAASLVLAWYHAASGRQALEAKEIALLVGIAIAWLTTIVLVLGSITPTT